MVLGGAITGIVTPDTNLVGFEIEQYSDKFTLLSLCQGGSPPPTLSTVSATASASYHDAAKLCSVTLLSPSPSPVDLTPLPRSFSCARQRHQQRVRSSSASTGSYLRLSRK